jgi:Na+/H+ antiporter NhaD/arsenite permease-like protein
MSIHSLPAILIFVLAYILIAARRLSILPIGRPAGALLGAVLMVVVGAVSPEQSYRAIDGNTIVLLLGMMLLAAYIERAGLFDWAAAWALATCRTGFGLLAMVSILSGVLSAVLVNDTVCLFLAPIVISACRRARLPMGPYLIALATSANIGSAATLVGNPQNMIIGSMSGIGFRHFLSLAGPAAVVGLLVNLALLFVYYNRSLPGRLAPQAPVAQAIHPRKARLAGLVAALVIAGFFAGFHLGYTALGGAMILVLADREDPHVAFGRVDWPLLMFFSCLFIVVDGLARTGVVDAAWRALAPAVHLDRIGGLAAFSALVVAGSNLVSNVPLVMLAGPHVPELGHATLGWVLLGYVSTVAGNLTLVGSVANIIVAERARKDYALGFREYLRFGLVSTLVVLVTAGPVVWWLAS